MTSLSVRNVTCDYYLEKPNGFNKLRLRTNIKVPIIRMFGILETGQKCCVHVHGVFPYIVIRTGVLFTPEFAALLRNKINAIVMDCNPRYKFNVNFAIYQIKSITVRSLYGYHKDSENFVQILCYNPLQLKIVADALQKEARKNSIFQVYESHVPYVLQFFVDHSIFGMDLVNFNSVKFRVSPQRNFNDFYYQDLKVKDIVNNIELVSPLLPSTTAAVECDVFSTDINVSLHSTLEVSNNPGLNYIWKDEQRRRQKKGEELIRESSQDERPAPDTEKERDYLNRLHVFFKGSTSNSFFGATLNDVLSLPEDIIKVERNLGNDFEASGTGIFDEELFLETEDEMKEVMEDDEQEIEEDFDLREEIGTVHETVRSTDTTAFQFKLQQCDPNFAEKVSDESDSDDDAIEDEITSITSGVENASQVSNNSSDLFGSLPENTRSPIASAISPGYSGGSLRNSRASSQHSLFSSKSSSQTSTSNTASRNRERSQHSQQGDEWVENEEVINCAESYEMDIESAWIPKGQQNLEPVFSKSEQWLRPFKRLPLRKKMSQIYDNGESIECASQPKKAAPTEQFFTESFSEKPSFIDYENTKGKLEQTLVAPSVTPSTSEEQEQADIHHLCVMSMEILALTSRGMPIPDPQHDQILGIFYTISTDVCMQDEMNNMGGVLLNMDERLIGQSEFYTFVASEIELFDAFVSVVRRYDPDIVIGFNTQRYSWGYLTERSLAIGRNLLSEISRVPIGTQTKKVR
uniref:DNA polymerase n=1 Tax=Elaeophora elaphi TaxID=1147741 RepID=A0A0R3RZD2_9BILA